MLDKIYLAIDIELLEILKSNKKVVHLSALKRCTAYGGPEGTRTLGLRVANAALYQLSYEPELERHSRTSAGLPTYRARAYYSTNSVFVKI